jgi:hypothetical protein
VERKGDTEESVDDGREEQKVRVGLKSGYSRTSAPRALLDEQSNICNWEIGRAIPGGLESSISEFSDPRSSLVEMRGRYRRKRMY